jgi:hypothetical protein
VQWLWAGVAGRVELEDVALTFAARLMMPEFTSSPDRKMILKIQFGRKIT